MELIYRMGKISLDYGKRHIDLEIDYPYHVLENEEEVPDINWSNKISLSFNHPCSSPTLSDLVAEKQPENVVIIVNDITRPVPYELVLKPMLNRLESSGINPENILLLIATGIHRPMTEKEVEKTIGKEIIERYNWQNHRATKEMISLGKLDYNIPLEVNPAIVKSDLVMAVGVIAPHYMAGYSGGRKSLLPGVCGQKTIETHHALMTHSESRTANLKNNPFHETMVEGAKKAGLDFIANVVVNNINQPVDIVTGHFLKAWQKGVELCREMSVIEIDKPADAVVVSAGGYPKDINMYQAQKALENASYCVKKGAPIILLAECREGPGEETFVQWLKEEDSFDSLAERTNHQFELGGHKAFAVSRVTKDFDVYLFSELSAEFVKSGFMTPLHTIEQINELIREKLSARKLIYFIPHGVNTVPVQG